MTPFEREELAKRLVTSIKAGDLAEVQKLLDIADNSLDEQPQQPSTGQYAEYLSHLPIGA